MSLTREDAQGWLDQVTEAIINGTTDSITPVIAATAVAFALLDVADAIREQTAAEYERQAIIPHEASRA